MISYGVESGGSSLSPMIFSRTVINAPIFSPHHTKSAFFRRSASRSIGTPLSSDTNLAITWSSLCDGTWPNFSMRALLTASTRVHLSRTRFPTRIISA